MVVSFSLPWWVSKFSPSTGIWIYGWGLRHNLIQFAGNIASDVTPHYQSMLAWIYIGCNITAIGYSSISKNRWGAFLLGSTGLGYIVYALVSVYIVIRNRAGLFGIGLNGPSIPIGSIVSGLVVESAIQSGFYLALATGALIVLIATIRFGLDWIKSKQTLS